MQKQPQFPSSMICVKKKTKNPHRPSPGSKINWEKCNVFCEVFCIVTILLCYSVILMFFLQHSLNSFQCRINYSSMYCSKIHRSYEEMVDKMFELHQADTVGRMDYAASYMGGYIHAISPDTIPYKDKGKRPSIMITPDFLPGSCFAFVGSKGAIQIVLGAPIVIKSITLSHASILLLNRSYLDHTPKTFEIYGFVNVADAEGLFLGRFTYRLSRNQHQKFFVREYQDVLFKKVEMRILSNYGGNYTCVYRLGVHNV